MSSTALIVSIGGTQMSVDYDDYFEIFPMGTFNPSVCRMCGAMTVAAGTHLEYHIAKGDYLKEESTDADKD